MGSCGFAGVVGAALAGVEGAGTLTGGTAASACFAGCTTTGDGADVGAGAGADVDTGAGAVVTTAAGLTTALGCEI